MEAGKDLPAELDSSFTIAPVFSHVLANCVSALTPAVAGSAWQGASEAQWVVSSTKELNHDRPLLHL